jgi:hypothetical protein
LKSNLTHFLRTLLSALLAASFLLAIAPTVFADTTLASVQSASSSPLQSLATFARSVSNGRSHQLVGVYAPNVMSVSVVQQPGGNSAYVSTQANTLTQFAAASSYGSTGLLAHNTLAGADFYKLKAGDTLSMVYGDGTVALFRVRQIQMYQALDPYSPYSNFVDLSNPGVQLTSTDLFKRTYGQAGVLVLQTCLSRNGNDSWGRTFIIATPFQGNAADVYKTYGYGKISGKINPTSLSLSYAH